MNLQRWDCDQDGTLTEAGLRRKLEQLGYSVARYVYPPGTSFPEHSHVVEKADAVLSGRLRITMGADSIDLGPGDCIVIPQGTRHTAEVIGETAVISLDATKP